MRRVFCESFECTVNVGVIATKYMERKIEEGVVKKGNLLEML